MAFPLLLMEKTNPSPIFSFQNLIDLDLPFKVLDPKFSQEPDGLWHIHVIFKGCLMIGASTTFEGAVKNILYSIEHKDEATDAQFNVDESIL